MPLLNPRGKRRRSSDESFKKHCKKVYPAPVLLRPSLSLSPHRQDSRTRPCWGPRQGKPVLSSSLLPLCIFVLLDLRTRHPHRQTERPERSTSGTTMSVRNARAVCKLRAVCCDAVRADERRGGDSLKPVGGGPTVVVVVVRYHDRRLQRSYRRGTAACVARRLARALSHTRRTGEGLRN